MTRSERINQALSENNEAVNRVGSRLTRLAILAVGMTLATACESGAPCARTPSRPNVVMIVIDDLGWADLGVYGNRRHQTPNIDRLARQGVRFTHAYANAPNCAPARASLLSGQLPPRHGIYTVNSLERGLPVLRRLVPPENRRYLPLAAVTVAEALQAAGYRTANVGKWHLGGPPEHAPMAQGFDVDIGSGGGIGNIPSHVSPYDIPMFTDGPPEERLADRLTTEAIAFIEANRSQPFFLLLSHYAVHQPLQAPPELIEKYAGDDGANEQRATYAAMIEETDSSVGRLLRALDELGLSEDTVVFLLSDNGGMPGWSSRGGLREAKGTIYEGGLRVPLIVRWPAKVPGDTVRDTPVSAVDLYPTILDMTATERPPDYELDGVSLLPLLRDGRAVPERALYWHFPGYMYSTQGNRFRTTPCSVVRSGAYKLIRFYEDERVELYDLAADPGEERDLSAELEERVNEMGELLSAWLAATNAPIPQPKPSPTTAVVRPDQP